MAHSETSCSSDIDISRTKTIISVKPPQAQGDKNKTHYFIFVGYRQALIRMSQYRYRTGGAKLAKYVVDWVGEGSVGLTHSSSQVLVS